MDHPDIKVVHLQPSDVVLIGNAGEIPDLAGLDELQDALKPLKVFVFAENIDIQLLRESTCPYCQEPDSACPVHRDGDG